MFIRSMAVGLGVIVVTSVCFLVLWVPMLKLVTSRPSGVPADEEVQSVSARLYQSKFNPSGIPAFAVPSKEVPELLSWLRPGSYELGYPKDKLEMIGELHLRCKGGQGLEIRFADAGVNGPAFVVNDDGPFIGRDEDNAGRPRNGAMMLALAVEEAFWRSPQWPAYCAGVAASPAGQPAQLGTFVAAARLGELIVLRSRRSACSRVQTYLSNAMPP